MNKDPRLKVFLVWDPDADDDDSPGYWMQYGSIEEALQEHGDGVDVYEAHVKFVGTYRIQKRVVKSRRKKKI